MYVVLVILAVLVIALYFRLSKLRKLYKIMWMDLYVIDKVLMVKDRLNFISKIEEKAKLATKIELNDISGINAVAKRWVKYQDTNKIDDIDIIPCSIEEYCNDCKENGGYYSNNEAMFNMMACSYGHMDYIGLQEKSKNIKAVELVKKIKYELENAED